MDYSGANASEVHAPEPIADGTILNARKFGYDVRVHRPSDSGGTASVQTLGVGVKKFSRVGMGVPGIYIAVWFGAKLTILWATNGVASPQTSFGVRGGEMNA